MTKSDRRHIQAVQSLGCVACIVMGTWSVAEVHHVLSGGRRMGHKFVIGLCPPHHRGNRNDEQIVSRHPYKAEFERRYGSEAQLLERVSEMLKRAA